LQSFRSYMKKRKISKEEKELIRSGEQKKEGPD
jgi:hypothetical protein